MDKKHPSSKGYPPELKERAVEMALDLQRQDPSDCTVIGRVARVTPSRGRWITTGCCPEPSTGTPS